MNLEYIWIGKDSEDPDDLSVKIYPKEDNLAWTIEGISDDDRTEAVVALLTSCCYQHLLGGREPEIKEHFTKLRDESFERAKTFLSKANPSIKDAKLNASHDEWVWYVEDEKEEVYATFIVPAVLNMIDLMRKVN